jgi:cell wall assembly regulator SMI1
VSVSFGRGGVEEVIVGVRDPWRRIEAWLAERARFVLDTLNPGTTVEAIQAIETSLRVGPLPDDFVQSWRIHDGQHWNTSLPLIAGWLGSYSLLSLDRIESRYDSASVLLSEEFNTLRGTPHGLVRPDWWNPRWVPVAGNASGDAICLDLDPPPGGVVGQVIEFLHDEKDRTVLAPSLGAWLEEFATELEGGEYKVFDATHDRYHGLVHVRDL